MSDLTHLLFTFTPKKYRYTSPVIFTRKSSFDGADDSSPETDRELACPSARSYHVND